MVLAESAARLAATLISILHTRVELAAAEVEEESQRYFSCLLLSLAAMFCAGMTIVLGSVLLVVVYWESHRVPVLAALIMLFTAAGVLIAIRLRSQSRIRPRLLAHTMNELSRDTEMLQQRA